MALGRVSHWWVRRVVGPERARVTGVFQCRPRARPLMSSHVRTRTTRQPRRRRRSRRIRNQDRDHNGHDQLSVLSLPNPFPKLTARARSQVRSRRDTVTDAAAAAQHTAVSDGGDRRSHGGAVARAMWQRRVTVRLQTITTARNDRAKARYFNSLLLGYAGGGGGERRWQGPRARAALWSAVAAVVLAAATCSPSGGGGSGGASYTRHRGRYVVRAVDLDPAVVRCKNFSTVGFVFRARSRHGRPGLGAHRPKPPGGGLLGCNSGSVI